LAKRTVKEIIEDWVFSVWKQDLPRTFHARRDAYYRLFATFAQEGYSWDDVGLYEEKYIKSFTVGTKGTGTQKKEWNEYADKHILDAKVNAFGVRGKIADSLPVKEEPLNEVNHPTPERIREAALPDNGKLKEHVPNQRDLEAIDKNFKFEVTDEDIE